MFERHYGLVLAYASRRAADDQQAQDVAAETFLTAWRRFDQVPDDSLPWLYGVARRVLANSFRSSRRRDALASRLASQAPETPASADPSEATEERLLFAHVLSRLRARDRDAVLLSAWEGLTNAQAARVLDISEDAFAARLHRARERLQAALEEIEGEGSSRREEA